MFEHPNARSKAIDERLTVVPEGETEKTGKGEGREDPPFALGRFRRIRQCREGADRQTVGSG